MSFGDCLDKNVHFSPGCLGVNRASIPQDLECAWVSIRIRTQMDGVHPRARERLNRQCNRSRTLGAFRGGCLLEVQKRGRYANNAVDSSRSTGNSGLPLSWQGRLLTNSGRVRCGNTVLYQACKCKTLQAISGTWYGNSTNASFCATQVGNGRSNSVFCLFFESSLSCWYTVSPLQPRRHIALDNAARDGDVIDNTGSNDLFRRRHKGNGGWVPL